MMDDDAIKRVIAKMRQGGPTLQEVIAMAPDVAEDEEEQACFVLTFVCVKGSMGKKLTPQERNVIAACYGEENADKVIEALPRTKPDPAFSKMFEEIKSVFFGPAEGVSRTDTLRDFVARNEPVVEEVRREQPERTVFDIFYSELTSSVKQKRTLGDVARERRKR